MIKTDVNIRDYYDEEVVKAIHEKYGISYMNAIRDFFKSETYRMMIDSEYEMWQFGPAGIFDMWESERITGNPRNSLYLRGDEDV